MTMRRMKRLLILGAASFAATASLTLPALADNGRSLHGTVASLTGTTISVKGRLGVVTTCALGTRSPSVAGYSVGDRVFAVCVRRANHTLTLAKLRKDTHATTPSPAADTEPVTFGGAITALDDASISLHDGDRDLTCALGTDSPSTAEYKVGEHVKVVCAGGVLTAISLPDLGRYFTGTVAALTDGSITLSTEHGPVTCTITTASPSTASLKVGDPIGMGCNASTMVLVLIKQLAGDDPPPTTTTPPTGGGDGGGDQDTVQKARGTIVTVGDGGVGVETDGGIVVCTSGDSSPSLDGYAKGDQVAIACTGGTLTAIERIT
jgi:hypothetical protein